MNSSNLSYWEKKTWFSDTDVCVIGSGIVGLSTAIFLKRQHPSLTIKILERGLLPDGGSTKNAGFACFGSLSELATDLKNLDETSVFELIRKRYDGLMRLRSLLGDDQISYKGFGAYELFTEKETELYEASLSIQEKMNQWLAEISGQTNVYQKKDEMIQSFGFSKVKHLIFNSAEGQIDTGMMMKSLINLARNEGIEILTGQEVGSVEEDGDKHSIRLTNGESFKSKTVVIATNAFAKQLIPELEVAPGRAQVLVTKPIKDLKFKGCFHLEEGYYYFRNIDNRVLFGGGRNLDKLTETTYERGTTELVQRKLEVLLREVILPDTAFEIERRWSGILGLGSNRQPIVMQYKPGLFIGVRMGGMGVAIGSSIGYDLSKLIGADL
ncbi:MAG: FAD-binding oxidoreductase [Bacteroidia bacterium]